MSRGLRPSFRFLSPLIEPDVRISRIRLSGWLHGRAHGNDGLWVRKRLRTPSSPNTRESENMAVPRLRSLCRRARKP
ncbi:MAG: hypothetical protein ACLQF2_04190, partial [Rhodomicrobium sp.]